MGRPWCIINGIPNVFERCINTKHWRGLATRFEKRAANYRAMVIITALMIWLPA
jgi:transposase